MKYKIQISLTGTYNEVMKQFKDNPKLQKASFNMQPEDGVYYCYSDDPAAVDKSIIVSVTEIIEEVTPVILACTLKQIKLQLLQINLFVALEAKLAAMPAIERINWESEQMVDENNEVINSIAKDVGWSKEQLTNFFEAAAQQQY